NSPFFFFFSAEQRGNLLIRIDEKGSLHMSHNDVTKRGGFGLATPAGSAQLNTWQHFAFTWDGTEGSLYKNGQKLAFGSPDPGAYSFFRLYGFRPLRLALQSYNAEFFKGCVDDLHIMSRAQSEEEIVSAYYSGMYRVSTDGGETWTKWEKLETSAADGTKEPVSVSVSGVSLPAAADSMNRVEFTARDIYGNTAVQQYTLLGNDAVPVITEPKFKGNITLQPNPFVQNITMEFETFTQQRVKVEVFGLNGKKVKTLVSGLLPADKHSISWDGNSDYNMPLDAGQYFASVKIGESLMVKRIIKLN
ncbi:MAG: T9SS type A sorting domain-containing protein, partial [Fibrobacteria bacterium]|nr:T9SS type A sorting domain-containing protein [Fibrobacteria bacterium]